MSKAKFKVGDTVIIIDGAGIEGYTGGFNGLMKIMSGETRKIREVTARGENGEKPCYYLENTTFLWDERGLEKVDVKKKIVITVSGKTTRAAIAFDRLVDACKETKIENKLEPLNTKIFVLDGANSRLKTAHIYDVVNGKIRVPNINGWWSVPIDGALYNMEDVVNYLTPCTMRENDKDGAGVTLSEFCNRKVTVMEVKEG